MLLTALLAGLAMGAASSLHCAGMCGPIASAMLMVTGNKDDPLPSLLWLQAGKAMSYVLAGAAFGVFGAGLFGVLDFTAAHAVLQWTAAITIVWTGLAVAGVVPAFAGLDRMLMPLATGVARLRNVAGFGGPAPTVLAGMAWGLTPCAMVYTALFNSLLTGSALGGMVMMAGFALGTVPAVTASASGMGALRRLANGKWRFAAGLSLAGAGVLGLLLTAPGSPLCITGANWG